MMKIHASSMLKKKNKTKQNMLGRKVISMADPALKRGKPLLEVSGKLKKNKIK
jgi:hypothetical protein